jgi:hypothetical protein
MAGEIMRPVKDWDVSDLDSLVRQELKEMLSLDYKGSRALSKQDKQKDAMSKDVSAMANSAGGILIYGIIEDKYVPKKVDAGVDKTVITKEWLESIISSYIQPKVEGTIIQPIDLPLEGPNQVAYALEIPAATSRAPHQAIDHKYYKRFNFESTPMEDYEVRDLMRRSLDYGRKYGAAWDLNVEVQRLTGAIRERRLIDGGSYLPRTSLSIAVSNALRSAGYAMILLAKPIRDDVAKLIKAVDAFNAIIETTDPGQLERARLNEDRKRDLGKMLELAQEISEPLAKVLETEP